MKTHLLPSFRIGLRLFLLLLAGIFIGATGSLSAAQSNWKSLPLTISADRQTATVTVPEGVGSVALQSFNGKAGWRNVTTQNGVLGLVDFKLPANAKKTRFRALGWFTVQTASHGKFPASFYIGKKSFGPVRSAAGSQLAWRGMPVMMDSVAAPATKTETTDIPVEADIWKVDGNTVYFFNQLRGLQVLDLSDPADPHLTASLRLPAVGDDLYVLPAAEADRTVILLTQIGSRGSGQQTRINVVKVSGGNAKITFTKDVPGSLADSRMVGDRLILATNEWSWSDINSSSYWYSHSRLTQWQLSADIDPQAVADEIAFQGYRPVIAAGPDWLAVSVCPDNDWSVSDVSVFAIRSTGLIPMALSIRTEGSVAKKFMMQWSGDVLTAISESWDGTRKTIIENFCAPSPEMVDSLVSGERLGRLELTKAIGESLYATRFAGDKAYIVTFRQTDPLWVVDLADPLNPVVAGSLEVPGWSSYLQPIGDLLFSIGLESGKVAASLFDVKDPAAPKFLDRVYLGEQWSGSEAIWNDKALKVLPDAGLAMVPLSASYWTSGTAGIQLVDIDLNAGKLHLRGKIAHEFDARRADLMGSNVVSISQRVMEVADVADRDAPAMLSEVSLAWPVNRAIEAGDYLFQIEDNQSYGNGRATARVSTATNPEAILSETDLGDGIVQTAEYRNGKLYVFRQTGSSSPWFYWARYAGGGGGQTSDSSQLILDIYDFSSAPDLALLGSSSVKPKVGGQISGQRLLWPQPNRPAIVMNYQNSYWGMPYYRGPYLAIDPVAFTTAPIPVDTVVTVNSTTAKKAESPLMKALKVRPAVAQASSLVVTQIPKPYSPKPYWIPQDAPQLILFDVSQPTAPTVQSPLDIAPTGSLLSGVCEAADGLLVAGIAQWQDIQTGSWLDSSRAFQSASVLRIAAAGTPVKRPSIDLPGELIAVSEMDSNGFLAFTRTTDDKGVKTLQVSASDGFDAYLVATMTEPSDATSTVGGRRIFTTSSNGVDRQILGDKGQFIAEQPLNVGWQPSELRCVQGKLIGTKWDSIFAASPTDESAKVWDFPTWSFSPDRVSIAADGDLLVPFGDYGVERLDRQ